MDPNQFLDLISYATDRSEDLVRLGTISTVADPPTKASVVFDGEDTATSKEYFFATSDGLVVNDRVMLVRAGHSWLIMGKVPSTSGFTNGPLTVEGDLDFQNNALIAADAGDTNKDHIWHDDANNKWHFVSDGSYKQVGNSWVRAGNFEVPHGGKFTNEADLAGMFVDRSGTRDYTVLYANDDIDFADNTLATIAMRVRPNAGQIQNFVDTYFSGDLYVAGNLFIWTSAGRAVLENVNEIRGDPGGDNDPTYTFSNANQTGFYLNSGHMSFTYNATRIFHVSGGVITGIGDNQHLLGNSSNRWKAVWAVDGTINTSDMSEKEEVIDSDLGLEFIKSMRPRRWRWRGGSRPHYGLAAQEVKQAIDEMGQDFAGFIDPAVTFMEDEYTEGVFEEYGPLGLRYHEFIAPMIKAIQELSDRVDNLSATTPRA